jgi:hypothetical protein
VKSTGGFFSGRAFFTDTFCCGTLTYGGPGSPANLTLGSSPPSLTLSGSNSSFSGLQADFPAGNYTFDLMSKNVDTEFTVNYAGNAYSNTPHLTAASFAALQGLNAAHSITLDFNAMDVSPNATPGANNIFFSVVNASNMTVFDSGALATTATSVTIPGGTLSAGQSYTFDLLFDDRIKGSVHGIPVGEEISTTQFYDTHTGGSFFTAAGAVPEPSTWAMLLVGFVGLGFAASLRGRKQGVAATGH